MENYERAYARGKGVLFLTAHFGGWELSAFAHSLHGHRVNVVMRPMDNPYLDRLLQSYRTMHGNKVVPKDDFVRGLLAAMKAGETVGILMDTNMTPPQGIFVDFFGIPACTASGLARIALRTDAAVVPGFTIWDESLGKYRLRFDPALELVRTGDLEADIVTNTQKFTKVIEDYVRKYPEQWLWVHRRWKTRPPGRKAAVLNFAKASNCCSINAHDLNLRSSSRRTSRFSRFQRLCLADREQDGLGQTLENCQIAFVEGEGLRGKDFDQIRPHRVHSGSAPPQWSGYSSGGRFRRPPWGPIRCRRNEGLFRHECILR